MFFWFDRPIDPTELLTVTLFAESQPITNLAGKQILPFAPGPTAGTIGQALDSFDLDENNLNLNISSGLQGQAIGSFALRYSEPSVPGVEIQSFGVASITVAAVPEPSSVVMLTLATALFVRRQR